MIVILGILVQNNNISRLVFHFSIILIIWAANGIKGQKLAPFDGCAPPTSHMCDFSILFIHFLEQKYQTVLEDSSFN